MRRRNAARVKGLPRARRGAVLLVIISKCEALEGPKSAALRAIARNGEQYMGLLEGEVNRITPERRKYRNR